MPNGSVADFLDVNLSNSTLLPLGNRQLRATTTPRSWMISRRR